MPKVPVKKAPVSKRPVSKAATPTKAPAKSSAAKGVAAKTSGNPPKMPLETRRAIPRVFECIVHLERALAHVDAAGILVGTPEQIREAQERRERINHDLNALLRSYREEWERVQKILRGEGDDA